MKKLTVILDSPWVPCSAVLLSVIMRMLYDFPDPVSIFAWIAPVPVLFFALKRDIPHAALYGFLYGFFSNFLFLWEIFLPVNMPVLIILLINILIAFLMLFIFTATAWTCRMMDSRAWAGWIYASILTLSLVSLEIPMAGGHGLPMLVSQYETAWLRSLSALGGPYIIYFIVSLAAGTLSVLLLERNRTSIISAGTAAMFITAAIFTGVFTTVTTKRTIKAAAVVHNKTRALEKRWWKNKPYSVKSEETWKVLSRYEELSRKAAEQGARIIGWNEYAVRIRRKDIAEFHFRLEKLARETGAAIIASYIDADKEKNQALIVSPDAKKELYTKYFLIAGVESSWLKKGDKTFGILEIKKLNLNIAVRICNDNWYPSGTRRAAAAGADIMVTPTADWPAVKELHAAADSFRAAENRLAHLRPASGGISALIDPSGKIVARQQCQGSRDILLVGDLPIARSGTFYSRHGNWFLTVCVFILLGAAAYSVIRKIQA